MKLLPLSIHLFLSNILLWLLALKPIAAQIVPDSTLLQNSTLPSGCTVCEITGGTPIDKNLFHSFELFSVPKEGVAYFRNDIGIENIITRVTGSSKDPAFDSGSRIDGVIRANGNANLFLINPKGIIFGPNAALNIGGSFIASTASTLRFADGAEFSATNPPASSVLTVSVPSGLQYGQSASEIRNESISGLVTAFGFPVSGGLQVLPGRTLALVGGKISLPGGILTADGGRIELGSVASPSLIKLAQVDNGWTLGYEGVQSFEDIHLSQGANLLVSGLNRGSVQLQGKNIVLTDGSAVVSNTLGSEDGGNLIIKASESVDLSGDFTGLFTEALGTSRASSIEIATKKLVIRDGAGIATITRNEGQAGNIVVKASESVELKGITSFAFPSGIASQVDGSATGDGGDVRVETDRLLIHDGAAIDASTLGVGQAGSVSITAFNSIELVGFSPRLTSDPEDQLVSGIFAQVSKFAVPNAGDAGNLTIKTGQLDISAGAQISSAARTGGRGGSITINADSIRLSGAAPNATETVGRSGIFVSAEKGATKDAGELNINTNQLIVENRGEISANNFGPGQGGTINLNVGQLVVRNGDIRATSFEENLGRAGNLVIDADSIFLDGGHLTAETAGKGGANISLQDLNLLRMKNQSQVSARALNQADGGNIIINAPNGFVIAAPNQNNDIVASAERGEGGDIRITTQSIFGLEEREAFLGNTTNDIDASSEFGLQGTVNLNTLEIDPTQGLVELPLALAEEQLAQGCRVAGGQTSAKFFNTGRGGLSPTPYEALSSSDVLDDVRIPRQASGFIEKNAASASNPRSPESIVEAQGWVMSQEGTVMLVAASPDTEFQSRCSLH